LKDLLERLLEINPDKRIGNTSGLREIREHRFFNDFDWDALRSKTKVRPPIDVEVARSNFETEYTCLPIEIDPLVEF
jgi:hypothetical protein